jgi:hypothetical protein
MDKQHVVYPYNRILLGHKKTEVLINATTWMNLKNMLSERSQSQKPIYSVVPFI